MNILEEKSTKWIKHALLAEGQLCRVHGEFGPLLRVDLDRQSERFPLRSRSRKKAWADERLQHEGAETDCVKYGTHL